MIKLARAATLAVLVGSVLAGLAPTASADMSKTKVLETITLRAKASGDSTAVGTIPKGSIIMTDSTGVVKGKEYTACGATQLAWYATEWQGIKGYVVASCIQLV
ncbi:hypothetical protein [Nocardia sp. NPDC019395]|uniref:hypothetical protein n=1 Tax=Nocardia sp. NPDC019395 TaxID=3154686 RepID=UPI0033E15DCE